MVVTIVTHRVHLEKLINTYYNSGPTSPGRSRHGSQSGNSLPACLKFTSSNTNQAFRQGSVYHHHPLSISRKCPCHQIGIPAVKLTRDTPKTSNTGHISPLVQLFPELNKFDGSLPFSSLICRSD
ncbi:hypothetical protein CDAR_416671 [Caerostris darwini]|uniref:Uncharacterized protein n=1 Tax=Caerostris darwini TaxID=1538125 RepID=A0AAV4MHY5_9ARAC|nr:hypothetical protein CDAR_416671 [Caerostris darwini]